jgi:hypothetical protein
MRNTEGEKDKRGRKVKTTREVNYLKCTPPTTETEREKIKFERARKSGGK